MLQALERFEEFTGLVSGVEVRKGFPLNTWPLEENNKWTKALIKETTSTGHGFVPKVFLVVFSAFFTTVCQNRFYFILLLMLDIWVDIIPIAAVVNLFQLFKSWMSSTQFRTRMPLLDTRTSSADARIFFFFLLARAP